MNFSLQNIKKRKRLFGFSLLLILAVYAECLCSGEQSSVAPVMPMTAPSEIRWVSGPQRVSLGALADIEVPQGYRLTDAKGARLILAGMKNPVPDGLIGIVTPESGKWWAVLLFTDVGYMKSADKERIDSAAVLRGVQQQGQIQNKDPAKAGMSSIVSVNWERPPVYDAESHSLKWAIRAETESSKVVNDTFLLLGRRGVLEMVAVQPYEASSAPLPLQQLMQNITFKVGERYVDFKLGDKIARASLAQLIVDDKLPAGSTDSLAGPWGSSVHWIYSVFGGGAVVVVGIIFYKYRRQRRQNGGINVKGSHGNGSGSELVKAVAQKGGRHYQDGERVFDYGRFYMDMMMNLTSYSSAAVVGPVRNERSKNGAMSHTNGASGAANQAIADATLALIASQKNLIEEQRHLILQQNRLLEERRKLSEEQNVLVRKQSQMIEDQFSMKLE